jgi:hypothetical protein
MDDDTPSDGTPAPEQQTPPPAVIAPPITEAISRPVTIPNPPRDIGGVERKSL